MPHRILRLDATLGVPHKTLGDEVNEKFIVAAENLGEGFSSWSSPASLRVHHRSRGTGGVKEEPLPGTPVDKVPVREAENFHYAR